jgi:hypothetical protein
MVSQENDADDETDAGSDSGSVVRNYFRFEEDDCDVCWAKQIFWKARNGSEDDAGNNGHGDEQHVNEVVAEETAQDS